MKREAARRARRACIARRLDSWRAAGAAVGPARDRLDSLTWRELDALPDWLALDDRALATLIPLAGAVALLPAVRRCVHGATLRRFAMRFGEARFRALRSRPYRAGAAVDCPALRPVAESSNGLPNAPNAPDGLDAQLQTWGVRVLHAALHDPALGVLAAGALAAAAVPEDAAEGVTDRNVWNDSSGDSSADSNLRAIDASACLVALELLALASEPVSDSVTADAVERPAGQGRAA